MVAYLNSSLIGKTQRIHKNGGYTVVRGPVRTRPMGVKPQILTVDNCLASPHPV